MCADARAVHKTTSTYYLLAWFFLGPFGHPHSGTHPVDGVFIRISLSLNGFKNRKTLMMSVSLWVGYQRDFSTTKTICRDASFFQLELDQSLTALKSGF
jgi:hypothetical protein